MMLVDGRRARTVEAARITQPRRIGPRKFSGRLAGGATAAVASGLLMALAFPPFDLWWLICIALVPMIVAWRVVLPRRIAWVAAPLALGTFYAAYVLTTVDASFAWWMAWTPLPVAVAAGLISWGLDRLTGTDLSAVVMFAVAWAAFEFMRGLLPGIGTQGYPAYALYRQPWLIQPIGIAGVHALNLLIMMVNAALGVLAIHLCRRTRKRPLALMTVATAAAAVTWAAASILMYDTAPATVRVAAVQVPHGSALGTYVNRTASAARRGAGLIVWPEKVLDVDPAVDPAGEQLADLARATGSFIALGYGVDSTAGLRNEATLMSPDGVFLGTYGKQHPAAMFADDETSVTAGDMPVYSTPFGRIATIICFDLDYTDSARHAATRGAEILAVPSWDPPGNSARHYTLLVFRAVENRLTIVKADAGHDSAIIDPYGRLVVHTATTEPTEATLVASVPRGSGETPLVGLGDIWGWGVVAGAMLIVSVSAMRSRRR